MSRFMTETIGGFLLIALLSFGALFSMIGVLVQFKQPNHDERVGAHCRTKFPYMYKLVEKDMQK